MPRDGTGNYTQPEPNVASGTTIESAVYNHFTADVAADLNWPRPILAGGTGASNAVDARAALGAETAMQTVTNYDMHVWQNGSFWSANGATAAPAAGTYSGIVYIANNDPNYITVEARETNSGKLWVRQKAGTWGAWVAHDGMVPASGGVPIAGPMAITNTTASTSVDTGALTVDGGVGVNGDVHVGGSINVVGDAAAEEYISRYGLGGVYRFGPNPVTNYLYFDGAKFDLMGGPLNVNGATVGSLWATSANFSGNVSVISGTFSVGGATTLAGLTTNGALTTNGSNIFNQSGTAIDASGGGPFMIQSSGQAMITLHNQGSFAANLGFIGADLYFGGWSFGAGVKHRVLSTKDLNPAQLFAGLPVTIVGGEGYWTSTGDEQKMLVAYPNAITITINGAAHPVGAVITFYCHASNMSINNTETMTWRGPSGATSGNRGLGQFGTATAVKWTGGNWTISGNGLT